MKVSKTETTVARTESLGHGTNQLLHRGCSKFRDNSCNDDSYLEEAI